MIEKKFRYGTVWLLGIITLAYILQQFIPGFTESFLLDSSKAFSEPWRFLTAIFMHASITHILLNGFALFLFGLLLEKEIGTKKFLLLFFATGIFANIVSVFFYNQSLGASGAIFGIMGMLAVLRPMMTVWVSYVPMPMIIAIFVWIAIDTFGILMPSNVANIAHISGALFGLLAGIIQRFTSKEPKTRKREPISTNEEEALDEYEREQGLR